MVKRRVKDDSKGSAGSRKKDVKILNEVDIFFIKLTKIRKI
jgi:hypothetical protein